MKKIILLFISISFIFLFASCKAVDNPTNASQSKVAKNVTNIPSVTKEAEAVTKISSDNQSAENLADIPANIKVVYAGATSERRKYEDLKQVEDLSTIIIEAVPKKTLGQKVETSYDAELKQDLPSAGYTKWEVEVTKVYKGDVKVDDKLVFLHDYYRWTYPDGTEELITLSSMKPPIKDKKYLMFLQYDETNKGYCAIGDYEGMFAIPTDEKKTKMKNKTLKQSDLDVYNYEPLQYIVPIYGKVVSKYFD